MSPRGARGAASQGRGPSYCSTANAAARSTQPTHDAYDSVSRETVGRLAENDVKPWQRKMWCIPAVDAEFIVCMEDVLDL